MAVTPIQTINVTRAIELKEATRGFNFTTFLETSITPYTDSIGNVFWLFMWLFIFVSFWIRQRKMTFPTIVALVFSSIFILMLPEEYQLYARLFIALGVFATLYTMFQERR